MKCGKVLISAVAMGASILTAEPCQDVPGVSQGDSRRAKAYLGLSLPQGAGHSAQSNFYPCQMTNKGLWTYLLNYTPHLNFKVYFGLNP